MQKITQCLWFDNQAVDAANFYASIFKNSKVKTANHYDEAGAEVSGQPKGSVMTVPFEIEGMEFLGLNGGPIFKLNPSISFLVYCKDKEEIDELYEKLSAGGMTMMPLDKYPFCERYAFISDKFGVSWQLFMGEHQGQKIVPSLLFVGKVMDKTEEAINLYTKIFKNSKINHIEKYKSGEEAPEGSVKFASFILEGQEFSAMAGPGTHHFEFNEATSFVVNCENQEEVDYYWDKLTADGGQESQCGWLKDKFGVSWQITPSIMGKLMSDKDPEKSERVMKAMLKMKKLDVKKLEEAAM